MVSLSALPSARVPRPGQDLRARRRRRRRGGVAPPRGARAQGRARRRRRRPRRRGRARGRPVAARPGRLPARLALQGASAAATGRAPASTAPPRTRWCCACRRARSSRTRTGDARWDLLVGGPARGGGPRRHGRARQPALRHLHAPDAALRRARAARRGALARAAPQAARRRRPRGAARTRASRRCWPGSRAPRRRWPTIPFTTLEPVLGTLERRRPPARAGRHPGPDRGRQRRRRAGPRVPRPRGALPAARARARPAAARRLRPGGEPRDGRGRAPRARPRPGRRCRGCSASRRATSLPAERVVEARWRSGASGRAPRCWPPRRPPAPGSTSWRARSPGACRWRTDRARTEPAGELPATHRVYRPGDGRRDPRGAHRAGRVRGARAAARAPDRTARREQRRGDALRRGAAALARRDQGARGRGLRARATTWRSPASCSSSIPVLRSGRSQPVLRAALD